MSSLAKTATYTHNFIPPNSPEFRQKMEKDIIKEAKWEEQQLNRAIKDLNHTEKAEIKAEKVASKADNNLQKSEKKEQSTLQSLNKATERHDNAVAGMHTAERDTQARHQQQAKLQAAVDAKKAQVDTAIHEFEAHKAARVAKLAEIQGQAAGPEPMN